MAEIASVTGVIHWGRPRVPLPHPRTRLFSLCRTFATRSDKAWEDCRIMAYQAQCKAQYTVEGSTGGCLTHFGHLR